MSETSLRVRSLCGTDGPLGVFADLVSAIRSPCPTMDKLAYSRLSMLQTPVATPECPYGWVPSGRLVRCPVMSEKEVQGTVPEPMWSLLSWCEEMRPAIEGAMHSSAPLVATCESGLRELVRGDETGYRRYDALLGSVRGDKRERLARAVAVRW